MNTENVYAYKVRVPHGWIQYEISEYFFIVVPEKSRRKDLEIDVSPFIIRTLLNLPDMGKLFLWLQPL